MGGRIDIPANGSKSCEALHYQEASMSRTNAIPDLKLSISEIVLQFIPAIINPVKIYIKTSTCSVLAVENRMERISDRIEVGTINFEKMNHMPELIDGYDVIRYSMSRNIKVCQSFRLMKSEGKERYISGVSCIGEDSRTFLICSGDYPHTLYIELSKLKLLGAHSEYPLSEYEYEEY